VLVTGLVFSYMNGIIHPYYMVALAPGIAALVGIGAMAVWQPRPRSGSGALAGRITAAAGVLASAVWAYILLDRTPDWLPWLRWVVLVAGVAGAGLLLAGPALARQARSSRGRLALAAAPVGLALVAGLAGPAAYALDTVGTAHTGAIPSAGPQVAGFGGPGGGPGGRGGSPGAGQPGRGMAGTGAPGGAAAPGGIGVPGGTGAASGSAAPGGTAGAGAASGGMPSGTGTGGMPRGGSGGFGAGNGQGGGGGLGGSTTVSSALTRLLEQDASSYTWIAATEGSEGAAPLELATGDAVMAIGGFNGTDPWPTLAVFKELVARHEIHYYVGQGSQSFGGGRGSSAIAAWVAAHFTKQTVGGQTVYDLTRPLS
jgi:4-amino-4-deoxy-L-arabinose transferase-like glycosyltransferase